METAGDGRRAPRRAGRPRLRTDSMVDAALQIIDEDGADALSMRSLAQRLSSSTATLYRHFPNRAALVVAVIDRIIGEIDGDSEELRSGAWRQVLRRIAIDYFAALKRHPGVARLLADHTPAGPNAMALRELWLGSMLNNGFPVGLAARSGALMASYVQGFAIQLAGERASARADTEVLTSAVGQLDPARFPALAAALASGAAPVALEDEFAFGLELMLDGLGAALDGAKVPSKPGFRRIVGRERGRR